MEINQQMAAGNKVAMGGFIDANKVDLRENYLAHEVYKLPIVLKYEIAQTEKLVSTNEGFQTAKMGDAILTGTGTNRDGTKGEKWPIPAENFKQTYDIDIEGPGTCAKKKITVLALEMDAPFSVKPPWSDKPLNGEKGDYLVQYGPGDMGIVAKDIFKETYRPIYPVGKNPLEDVLKDFKQKPGYSGTVQHD